MKLGYFHNGHFPPIEFEDFVRWGAANGYQVIDVPLFQPNARAICERHGLEPTSTTGMVCQPIASDATERAEQTAQARRGTGLRRRRADPDRVAGPSNGARPGV